VQKQLHTQFFGSCPRRGQLPKNWAKNFAEALTIRFKRFSFCPPLFFIDPALKTLSLVAASALSPKTWSFSLDWLPRDAYLVGGNVRDALLGRYADYLDLDFVMPNNAVATAQAIARHYRAGYVLLDAERQIARVVFDDATVDFAQQVGDSLESDLRRRDFTVNAIAYSPHTQELFDPLQGYSDLQHKTIRMIALENLQEDPLRLLRAYRQAAQLNFQLEPLTQAAIRELAPLLQTIAAERIQGELNYLLKNPLGTPMLRQAWQDGLLKNWLPDATAQSMTLLAQIDQAAIALDQAEATSGLMISGLTTDQKNVGTSRNWIKIAKLSSLVASELTAAEANLWRLKYSRAEVLAVLAVLKTLQAFPPAQLSQFSARDQYFLFREVGTAFPVYALMAIAQGATVEAIAPYIQRFLTPNDAIAHPTPVLSGSELMARLHLSPGPRIGRILAAIQLAQAEGKVDSVESALRFAAEWGEER
jgi:tRNA nucleotidyltransferase (CCA-adding enzyme)